jgi:hypothetical protein
VNPERRERSSQAGRALSLSANWNSTRRNAFWYGAVAGATRVGIEAEQRRARTLFAA